LLRVDLVYVIRHKALVEGQSIRRVAREMKLSRNTVRKYLKEAEPARPPRKPRRRPVLEEVGPRLEGLLEEWKDRTTPKQRITAGRLHRQLVDEGFEVGITTVQAWVRERRRRAFEVFVPLVHRAGDEAQVDFFEVTVDVAGKRKKVWKFVMRLMHSGRDFAWLYERCDQVSFLDGHVRAFSHFGAVPHRIIYDNLGAAVRKVMLPNRELADRFKALSCHYVFEPCFARPGVGHDKGGVEARGRGIRLQHLTPIPRGESLRELSAALLAALDRQAADKRDRDGRTVLDRFAEDKAMMLPLPQSSFDARQLVVCTVSRQARVKLAGAYYSVDSRWKLLEVTARVGVDTVAITCREERIEHPRQPFGGRSIQYRHYLPELAKKPQALRQVVSELLGELGEPFAELWRLLVDAHQPRDAARTFARVLGAIVDTDEPTVARAIRKALDADRIDLLDLAPVAAPITIEVPASLAGYEIETVSPGIYDVLLGGGQ
jgi:transposase